MQACADSKADRCQFLTALAREHEAELRSYLMRRLKSDELVHDIIQETFAKLLALKSGTRIDNPRGYIFRVALNLAIDHMRSKRTQHAEQLSDWLEQTLPAADPTPEDIIRHQQLANMFNDAYSELPQKSQQIFYMRRFEGMSTLQIARKFGVSQRMVQKSIAHIMSHFDQRLALYRQA